jgi:outer membrane protein
MKLKFISIITILLISMTTFGQQLFGHVNSQEILNAMPEAATAQLALQEELEGLQEQGQIMMQEFESQQKDFQINQENMNEAVRNDKLKSLENLQERIMLFEQSAEQSIQMKQAELFEPILTKIQNEIDEVAKENEYAYIFDLVGLQGGVVYKNDTYDVTLLVKKKLNL